MAEMTDEFEDHHAGSYMHQLTTLCITE